MSRAAWWLVGGLFALLMLADGRHAARAQEPSQPLDDTMEAGEAEAREPARSLVKWNHYEGRIFSIRMGGGVLFDYAGYSQDAGSRAAVRSQPRSQSA